MRFSGGIFLLVFPQSSRDFIYRKRAERVAREGEMTTEASPASLQANDDVLTICAISLLAEVIADVLHEGLGHAATALLTGAKSGVDDRGVVQRLRLATCCRGWHAGEPGGCLGVLDCTAQRDRSIGSIALFSVHKSCVQPVCRHRVFLFLGRHEFRRLGNGNRRLEGALVMAVTPGYRRSRVVLWRGIGRGHRAGSVRRSSW